MENYQGQILKTELMEKKLLINFLIISIMLLSIAIGLTAASFMLLKAI